mmetsp:Transcript_19915/g.43276  ORF Transcript_19915/g.43276 Transcript_19915/m.43276 type:complete len:401 (+) Transcript_19915:112-1314(+)|eukprot:CAMPEP_0168169178 /NCGR_PEP_ID=MMETSP0139_2-20121125/3502_1 /TAXON_ID=44445 /ORGANISM="Pseudo-nitzschia australis, Strain 10249 10 AB" /LENGTH=400 /DNA_ID=CAMNT_0008086585 /DNA_START=166 /DNA_END=1368 /DNA_ORIENTATION=+
MDAIVQLIRNALCCVKDWELFSDSIPMLYDPSHTNSVLDLPEYVNKTTPLEVIISVTQFYACVSCAKSGTQLAWTSAGKLKRIVRLLEGRLSAAPGKDASANETAAHRIVNESLVKEAKSAMRNTFVGLMVAPIGFAFFWLFANSWHVTEAGWIGGLTALIDALTVMEVCMIPLLYYMVVDGLEQFASLRKTKDCLDVVVAGKKDAFNPTYVNVTRYEFMEPGWVPFFEGGITPFSSPTKADEESNKIAQETKQVEQTLNLWFATDTDTAKDDSKEKDAKIRTEAIENAVATMNKSLSELSTKGYREFLYLVLNFVAFYGYLMAIVGFYYPDDDFQPNWIKAMKFGYDNNFADWSGNFAGDLMWTIEPVVILASPYYISYVQQQQSVGNTTTAAAKAKTE